MDKQKIIAYLQSKKETFKEQYKTTNIGFYGRYVEDKATANSNIFHKNDKLFELKSMMPNE